VAWRGQWALNAWENLLLTAALLLATLALAWQRGFSPLEMVSMKAAAALVGAVRRRFPRRAEAGS
jgi:inner membrane protein